MTGRVQGVFYRGTCVRKAESLGLKGYARNLPDGRVEVLACGEQAGVEQFILHTMTPDPKQLQAWVDEIIPNVQFPASAGPVRKPNRDRVAVPS